MDKQKTLIKMGLSKNEALIYLAAIELGESHRSGLAKKAGVKRATLYYDVLPKLIEKGLLIEVVKGKRKYLIAQDFQEYLEAKKDEFARAESLIPQLRTLLATANNKPQVLFYEGVDGIKKVWQDHLVQNQPILEFVGVEDIHPDLQKYIKEHYIWQRASKKIPIKMLVSGPTKAGPFNVKSDKHELREVKAIDGEAFLIPLGCDIYGDNVSITLHRKDSEPIGLIIRSSEIATMMRSIFNFIWTHAQDK